MRLARGRKPDFVSASGTAAFEGEQALLDSVLQDLRHALRLARSSPALMSIALASLALGIGVTVSMFTLVNAVLLRPVPVDSPEELALLFTGTDEDPYSLLSYPDFLDYREVTGVFLGLAAFGEIQVSLGGEGSAEDTRGVIASGNFFDVLGVKAARPTRSPDSSSARARAS